MQVSVTQAHIERGLQHSCVDCPVALALNDATGVPHQPDEHGARRVGWFVLRTEAFSPAHVPYHLPDEVLQFIKRFDARERVFPFTFTLALEME